MVASQLSQRQLAKKTSATAPIAVRPMAPNASCVMGSDAVFWIMAVAITDAVNIKVVAMENRTGLRVAKCLGNAFIISSCLACPRPARAARGGRSAEDVGGSPLNLLRRSAGDELA